MFKPLARFILNGGRKLDERAHKRHERKIYVFADAVYIGARLAVHTSDKEKLLRIFKASGQYRDEKPNAYYSKMADEELQFMAELRSRQTSQSNVPASKVGRYANAK